MLAWLLLLLLLRAPKAIWSERNTVLKATVVPNKKNL